MADIVEQISLSFTLPPSMGSGAGAPVGGNIQVDYTTNTVSGTISTASGNNTDSFSTYKLTYDMPSNTYSISATGDSAAADTLSFSYVSMTPMRINNVALALAGTNYAATSEPVAAAAVCFAQGTRIRAMIDGVEVDVAVEDLRVGDTVVTAGGAARPVTWLGHRTLDCRRHPRPAEVMPVRIAAHAFGPSRPQRDLVVSPGHAICVEAFGDVLVPARALVDGATVRQETVDAITYWHVAVAEHDILLAENLPAESYIDLGNVDFFTNGAVLSLHGVPDVPRGGRESFCRPFHADGAIVESVRARLAARAEASPGRKAAA